MAPRVSDYPPDEEWPDLEEEYYEDTSFPMGGPYAVAYEFLHGARITLDAGLVRPARLMAATAALNALALAEKNGRPADADERAALERIGRGEVEADAEAVLDALARLAVFVEKRLKRT